MIFFCFSIMSNLFSQISIEQLLINRVLFLDPKQKNNNNFIRCGLYKSLKEKPLYIVDGVPVEFEKLTQIDSNDIESIDLLKESTSGIISCRTRRDVILITTKQPTLKDIKIIDEQTRIGIPKSTITFKKRGTLLLAENFANEKGVFSYQFKNPNIDSISFSSIGYVTRTFTVEELRQNKFIVVLKKNAVDLKEIIISGHIISCRRSYGGQCGLLICNVKGVPIVNEEQPGKSHMKANFLNVKAFPNPVSIGGILQLNFGNTKPGLYQIRLLNSSGQLFYSFQKQISSSNVTEQIHLNERMSAGIYLLQVIDEKKKLVQASKVIVQ
jgi:hypothetical protein